MNCPYRFPAAHDHAKRFGRAFVWTPPRGISPGLREIAGVALSLYPLGVCRAETLHPTSLRDRGLSSSPAADEGSVRMVSGPGDEGDRVSSPDAKITL
jgi:hypothetical protein